MAPLNRVKMVRRQAISRKSIRQPQRSFTALWFAAEKLVLTNPGFNIINQ